MIRRKFFNLGKDDSQKSSGGFVYNRGIPSVRLYGKQPVSFCILPAFPDHEIRDGKMFDGDVEIPSDAWVPFIDEDGNMAVWCAELQIARFAGHGEIKQRRDVVSRRTIVEFDEQGDRIRIEDPYSVLQAFAKRDSATWGYLQKGQGEFNDPHRIGPTLPFIKTEYIVNAVKVDDPEKVVIGEISPRSAVDGLNALIMAPNKHVSDEDLARDYLKGYDCGDITDPTVGNVIDIAKEDDSRTSKYVVRLSESFDRVKRKTVYAKMKISEGLLRQRYDLSDIRSIVNVPTEEDQIEQLARLLCGRTPDGMYHEYSFMKEAFSEAGHDDWAALVPNPPQAAGRGSVRGYSPEQESEEVDEDPYVNEAEYDGAAPKEVSATDLPKRWTSPAKAAPMETHDPDDQPETEVRTPAAQESPKAVSGVPGEAQARPSWLEKYKARKAAAQQQ